MWYISMFSFAISIIPFIRFMFHLNVHNLSVALTFIALSAVLYIISSKQISIGKGYNAVQALRFYKACKKAELGREDQCKKHTVKFKEIANSFDFAKELEQSDIIEMYKIGFDIYNRKEK